MELPQYTARPVLSRLVIPQFFKLIGLVILFYFGIWINLSLLRITAPILVYIALVIILIILMTAQILITRKKSEKYKYDFYPNKIEYFGEKLRSVLYSDIPEVKISRNIFDMLTNTATISCGKKFKIKYIQNFAEIQNYINALVQNFRAQQAQV